MLKLSDFSHDIYFACVLKYHKLIIAISSLYFPQLAHKHEVHFCIVFIYLFALFNSDSVKQNGQTYLTLENMWQTVQM